jgi:hypothetical protein
MKTVGFLAIVFGTAFYLAACSSMEVPLEKAYGEQLPGDFSYSEFAELNQDIILTQTLDSITKLNAEWSQGKLDEGMAQPAVNAIKDNDDVAFLSTEAAKSIAKEYLQWLSEPSTVNNTRKRYIQKFNIMERDDELEFIKNFPIDSSVLGKTYLESGKRNGRAYRVCKDDEKQTLKAPDLEHVTGPATIPNYSAYSFCADIANGKPYPVYVIP